MAEDISPPPENPGADQRAIVHDLRQSLYSIHLGIALLKRHRLDPAKFDELCASIDHERSVATELLKKLAPAPAAKD